jgi:hypothetical protein
MLGACPISPQPTTYRDSLHWPTPNGKGPVPRAWSALLRTRGPEHVELAPGDGGIVGQ